MYNSLKQNVMSPSPFNYPLIDFDTFVKLRRLNGDKLGQFRIVRSSNPCYYLLQYRWLDCYLASDSFPWRTFACVSIPDSTEIKRHFAL